MEGIGTIDRGATFGRERAVTIALWVTQIFLAVQFAFGGVSKLAEDPAAIDLFVAIGVGQWLRLVVGALEVAGALGLLIPRLSGVAALGLALVMVGAVGTNMIVLDASPLVPLVILLLVALVAWGRWPKTRALIGMLGR